MLGPLGVARLPSVRNILSYWHCCETALTTFSSSSSITSPQRSLTAIQVATYLQRYASLAGSHRAGSLAPLERLRARRVAIYLSKELTDVPLAEIARVFNKNNQVEFRNDIRWIERRMNEKEKWMLDASILLHQLHKIIYDH